MVYIKIFERKPENVITQTYSSFTYLFQALASDYFYLHLDSFTNFELSKWEPLFSFYGAGHRWGLHYFVKGKTLKYEEEKPLWGRQIRGPQVLEGFAHILIAHPCYACFVSNSLPWVCHLITEG